ncbi:MAG TPA: MMPL family transporter [Chloroflexota bacterium]|nr:MMPL family transporter [Chloroflexota bacterium]
METFFAALGRTVVRWKYLVVVIWIAITAFSVAAFPSLASVAKDTNSGFLPSNTPSIQASNLASVFQNTKYATVTIVAARETAPLTLADQATIDRLMRSVQMMPKIKLVRDEGVSPDGKARQILVQADVSLNGTGSGKTFVDGVRHLFTTVGAPVGLSLHLTGQLPTQVDTQSQSSNSRGNTQSFSFIFILILLLIAFRAPLAPIVTLLPAALVLALSSPVIAASTRLGVQASSITQIILIVLVLGAGTDYGLFLVFRVREELRHGLAPGDAVVRALTYVGETISFSAFTVIAALLSLLAAQFGLYQGLGPALAIGIGLMLLAGLTFLPALLAILGRAVFWPGGARTTTGSQVGLWGRIGSRVLTHPAVTLGLGLLLFIALALGQLNSGITGFADISSGPSGSDSAVGQSVLAAHFPGSSASPSAVLLRFPQPIWSHLGTLDQVQQDIKASPLFVSVIGPTTPNGIPLPIARLAQLHAQIGPAQALPRVEPPNLAIPAREYNAYRATTQFISADGRTVQWATVLHYNGTGSSHDLNQFPKVRNFVSSLAQKVGASDSGVFGLMAFAYDVSTIATNDLVRILPIVAIVIALLLALVLRSLIAPLYLVASVVLSYLAALGFTAIVFVHLGPDTGLNFVLPFLMFVFLMALGSDYNILVMTRIREEARKMPLRQAVSHAVGISGGTITTAGVILAGTFAVLAVAAGNSSGADQIRQIGYGIAAGVIMDTFLIRTILVPSMVVLLGRWNWWPSELSRREHQDKLAA